jgi:hypothetical protein
MLNVKLIIKRFVNVAGGGTGTAEKTVVSCGKKVSKI